VEFVELHHDSEQPSPVGIELEDHLHSWGNFCSPVLHIYLALLMRDYGERGWETELELAESELSQAVLAVTSKGYELINRYIVYVTSQMVLRLIKSTVNSPCLFSWVLKFITCCI
jgi:hypothetical protein